MWTKEKLDKLKELYPDNDNNKISELLNIKRGYIIKKANNIGLFKNETYISSMRKKNNPCPPTYWSDIDTDRLLNLYKVTSNNELAKILNKSGKSVIKKLKLLNLTRTKEEKDYITAKKAKENGRDLSKDFVGKIALKYNTRGEFWLNDSPAYSKALTNNWLDDICKHMVIKGISLPQLILKDILEYMLNYKCLYNDRIVIKPLEIDCYFPNWSIGFEYDGKFYHNDIKDNLKKEICKSKNILLVNIHEHTKEYRNYEINIKNQLIDNLTLIEERVGFKIDYKKILEYKPNIIFPNLLTIFEKKIINGKKMSEIKKTDILLYNKIKKYKLYEDLSLEIINDLKVYQHKWGDCFEDYKIYLISCNYKNFNELCKYEHPHRLLKKFNKPITLIHELYK